MLLAITRLDVTSVVNFMFEACTSYHERLDMRFMQALCSIAGLACIIFMLPIVLNPTLACMRYVASHRCVSTSQLRAVSTEPLATQLRQWRSCRCRCRALLHLHCPARPGSIRVAGMRAAPAGQAVGCKI